LSAASVAAVEEKYRRRGALPIPTFACGITLWPVSTFLTYVRIQAMVFVCGIVGPIFLVLYFTIEPQVPDKWMYYIGLIITAFDVLIALALTRNAVESDATTKD
jgi:hypothetical protein